MLNATQGVQERAFILANLRIIEWPRFFRKQPYLWTCAVVPAASIVLIPCVVVGAPCAWALISRVPVSRALTNGGPDPRVLISSGPPVILINFMDAVPAIQEDMS